MCGRSFNKEKGTVVALGTFDGMHAGHLKVLSTAVLEAARLGLPSLVYTFRASPKNILDGPVRLLLPPEEKEARMKGLGIDIVMDVDFTPEVRVMSPRDFAGMLVRECRMREAVVGEDYTFGCRAAGNAETLREFGKEMGFSVVVVPLLTRGGEKISSTRIREALDKGDDEAARALREGDK